MKEKCNSKGITLVALVVTIIVLIILVGITIGVLNQNGLIGKAKIAKDETIKQEAIERINLKISSIQIESYAEKQELPTLQYLADKLCEDNDIEYVVTEGKTQASLNKITITDSESIYTKLKEYSYEFEINSLLQLASIDGIKVAESNPTGGEGEYIVKVDDAISNEIPKKDTGYLCMKAECSDENAQVEFNNDDWTITWKNVPNPKSVCTLYFYKLNNYKTLLSLASIDASSFSSIDDICQNEKVLSTIFSSKKAMEYLYASSELISKLPANLICSNIEFFNSIIEKEASFLTLLDNKTFREAMYSNYNVTQSAIANSTNAKNTIKKSPYYKSITHNTWNRTNVQNVANTTVLNERVFLLDVTVKYITDQLNIGSFADGTANYTLDSKTYSTINYEINKFMTRIARR